MVRETSSRPTDSNKPRRTTCKTGCRTCKVRKVKCDEGWPACYRCISTGRVCDGYGIWGGGGNKYGDRPKQIEKSISKWHTEPKPHVGLSFLVGTSEERSYFEWFTQRTVKKIPGPFVVGFWKTLLFQASVTEPAVFHAVVTLTFVHKGQVEENGLIKQEAVPNQEEQWVLKQYSKALSHLRQQTSTKSIASTRILLITCIVFTALEFLRGKFKTAQRHLTNGLQVLKEEYSLNAVDDGAIALRPAHDTVDSWIAEAFSRQHLQIELFHQTHQHSFIMLQLIDPDPNNTKFTTFHDVWQEIVRIFHGALYLIEAARWLQQHNPQSYQTSKAFNALVGRQRTLVASLARWSANYIASKRILNSLDASGFGHCIFSEYHAMATIMTATCLSESELSFDAHSSLFRFIIVHSTTMYQGRHTSTRMQPDPFGQEGQNKMSRSMAEVGWIAALYYTALKCRVSGLRKEAVKLLRCSGHREGIYDSRIVAGVAEKVIEIEEDGLEDQEGFDQNSRGPSEDGLTATRSPYIPLKQRLREVEVVLEDEMTDSVMVRYKRDGEGAEWEEVEVSLSDCN